MSKQEIVDAAVAVLREVAENEATPPYTRVDAASILLRYGTDSEPKIQPDDE